MVKLSDFPNIPKSWINESPYSIKNSAKFISVSGTNYQTRKKNFLKGDFTEWTDSMIKQGFNFGKGSLKDLKKDEALNKRFGLKYYRV